MRALCAFSGLNAQRPPLDVAEEITQPHRTLLQDIERLKTRHRIDTHGPAPQPTPCECRVEAGEGASCIFLRSKPVYYRCLNNFGMTSALLLSRKSHYPL